MPTIEITQSLADLIKKERKSRDLRGDVISRSLGKTNTFISQIETGKLSEIDFNLFKEVLMQIIEKENFDSFMNDLIRDKNQFKIKYSTEEINYEKDFISFQRRYCLIPIPSEIITFISDQLNLLKITGAQLIQEINKNKYLENPENYEDNEYYIDLIGDMDAMKTAIKFNLNENLIEEILSGARKSICYIFMLGIIYNILLLKDFSKSDASIQAEEILNTANFLTPYQVEVKYEKSKSQDISSPSEKYDLFEYEHYHEFEEHINNINTKYKILKASNILYINNALKNHELNMEDDPIFTLAILSSPLAKIAAENKVEFFEEYKLLLKKFSSKNNVINDSENL